MYEWNLVFDKNLRYRRIINSQPRKHRVLQSLNNFASHSINVWNILGLSLQQPRFVGLLQPPTKNSKSAVPHNKFGSLFNQRRLCKRCSIVDTVRYEHIFRFQDFSWGKKTESKNYLAPNFAWQRNLFISPGWVRSLIIVSPACGLTACLIDFGLPKLLVN